LILAVKFIQPFILNVPRAGIKYKLMHESDIAGADHERRFGGLTRLYGPDCLGLLRAAHVMVAGLGGVGSWCAEALVRSGIGRITLIDMDHVAESNVNRQLHALDSTLGQAKVDAMARRLADINPACQVCTVDDFITPDNTVSLLAERPDVLLDCTDQVAAKVAMVVEARRLALPVVVCGGAGGKTDVFSMRSADLSQAVHDALLARVRTQLRRQHGFPKGAARPGKRAARPPRMGVQAIWFDQSVRLPSQWEPGTGSAQTGLQGLSCAGYGSAVTITASMGMAAASLALEQILQSAHSIRDLGLTLESGVE